MTSSTPFEGKVALVTGAAAGIGKATALAFAETGAAVIVADVQTDKCPAVVESIKGEGTAAFVKCDVRSENDIRNMVSETVRQFGRLDCAFNNAGVPGGAFVPLAEQTNETGAVQSSIAPPVVALSARRAGRAMLPPNMGSSA